ncbi:uncharacterized protein [Antedon mediterranea]|uniref:uncharacterized protein n=1 Tax=Antedon mediterranea TaxID=105859 RepID=UPI003AF46522
MPLNNGKLKCLVNWINSIGVGNCIESLQQLNDGIHFIEILKIINGENGASYCDMPTQRFRLINTFLEDHYNVSNLREILKPDRISKGDMLELAKITSLFLSSAVQCSNNEQFVEPITKLDETSQMNLMEIIQHIIGESDDDGSLRHDFADILYKKVSQTKPNTPTVLNGFFGGEPMSCDDNMAMVGGSPTLPMFIPASPFIRRNLEQSPILSPIRKFMSSPQMAQKISIRKLQGRCKKFEFRVGQEIALRQDKEAELREKEALIKSKDLQIRELKLVKTNQRSYRDEADEHKATKLELEKVQREVARLRRKTANSGECKATVAHLEKEVETLMSERNEMNNILKNYDAIRSERDVLKVSLHTEKYSNEELQSEANHLSQKVTILTNSNEEMKKSAELNIQMLQEKIASLEEELADKNSLNRSKGESLGMIAERRLLDLEVEMEKLKSTWIEPGCHAALDKSYKEVCQAKKTFETNYIEAKTELFKALKHVSEIETELELSNQQCSNIANNLKCCQEKFDNLNQQLHLAEEQATTLQTENDSLQKELHKVKIENEGVSADFSRVSGELMVMSKENALQKEALDREREGNKKNVEHLKSHNQVLQGELETVADQSKREVEQIQSDLERIKMNKQSIESSMKDKLHSVQGSLHALQMKSDNQNWAQEAKIKALKEELRSARNKAQEIIEEERERLKKTELELEKVKKQLEEEKNDKAKKMSDGAVEFEKLQTQSENSYTHLLEQIKVISENKEKVAREWQETQAEKQTVIENLNIQVKSLKDELAQQTKQFAEEMEDTQQQSDNIALEHNQMLQDINRQLNAEKENNEYLKSKMSSETEKMQRNLENKNIEIEKLRKELQNLKTSLEEELQQKDRTLQESKEEIANLSEKVNEESVKNVSLLDEITRLSTELESYARNNKELTQKYDDMGSTLQQAANSNILLQEELDHTNAQMNKQDSKFLEMKVLLETEITEERRHTDNLREELNRKTAEMGKKTSEWEEREAELMKEAKEVNILLSGEQRKCQNLKESLEVLQDEGTTAERTKQEREEELTQKNLELKDKLNEVETQYEQNLSAMEFSTKQMRRKWEELRKSAEQRHEKDIEELKERYDREIETMKRGSVVKEDLLRQELEASKLELVQTKKQATREAETLKETKKHLEVTANEKLVVMHKQMENELNSYKKKMEKEAQQYKEKAEKLQKELTKTCVKADAYKNDIEKKANEKLQEMKMEMNQARSDWSEKLFALENENHIIKCKLEKLNKKVLTSGTELTEERLAKDHLAQRVRSLQTQLDYADRQLREKSTTFEHPLGLTKTEPNPLSLDDITDNMLVDSPTNLGDSEANLTADSLDASLNIDDLRGSVASLESNSSNLSTSSRPKSRTTIIINMSKTSTSANTSLNTSSVSTVNKTQTINHHSISNISKLSQASCIGYSRHSLANSSLGPDYPESLSRTLDELSASQSVLQSSIKTESPKSRATTGRFGFFMNDDESQEYDWNRLSELKRRNTLCLPHLQTSYPAETQACQEPISDLKTTKVNDGAAGMPSYQLRQTRKRKSNGLDDLDKSSKLRSTTSQPMLSNEVTKLSERRATSLQTFHNQNTSYLSSMHRMSTRSSSNKEDPSGVTFTIPTTMAPKARKTTSDNNSGINGKPPDGRKPLQKSSKVNEQPEATDPRRESLSFSIGFSPKPQFKRRSTRMSFGKGFLKSKTEKNKQTVEEGKETPKLKKVKTPKKTNKIGSLLKWN